jgi:hypothetical protein
MNVTGSRIGKDDALRHKVAAVKKVWVANDDLQQNRNIRLPFLRAWLPLSGADHGGPQKASG